MKIQIIALQKKKVLLMNQSAGNSIYLWDGTYILSVGCVVGNIRSTRHKHSEILFSSMGEGSSVASLPVLGTRQPIFRQWYKHPKHWLTQSIFLSKRIS